MKLFLILCAALLNFQFSVQEGYQGTHVYHDGDEDHKHDPLPSDVEQLSRSREKRPQHSTASPIDDNQKSEENRNHDNEESTANQSETREGTNPKSNEKLNTTPKSSIETHENPPTNDVKQENPTTSNQQSEKPTSNDVKHEDPVTSGQQYEKPLTNDVNLEKPAASAQQHENSATTNGNTVSDGKTGKIYETYPEAYEGITGNEYQGTSASNGSNIDVGKIGQTDSQNEQTADLEHGQRQPIYDDFGTAYEKITGKHYEGTTTNENLSNESTGKLEHGQSQKIYDNYTTAYEEITGKHYEGSQSDNNNDVPGKNSANNNSQGSTERTDGAYIECSPGHTACHVEGYGPGSDRGNRTTSNQGHSSRIPGGISVIVEDSSMVYLPTRTVVQKIPCPPTDSPTPSNEKSKSKNNNTENSVKEATNGLEHGQTQKLYDNYTTAYEAITGKKYEGAEPPNDRTHSVT